MDKVFVLILYLHQDKGPPFDLNLLYIKNDLWFFFMTLIFEGD